MSNLRHEKQAIEVPDWCDWGRGTGNALILAPHGGRRRQSERIGIPRRIDGRHRINDLHTADLAVSLAAGMRASFVANRGADRNVLDLNRISQVRKKAPWFLSLIADLAEAAAAHHREIFVLVVHGWNVGQGCCDLGIGAPDAEGGELDLTVSNSFLIDYLRPLLLLEDSRQRFSLGRRYPARHPNNLLQLFRRDGSRLHEVPEPLASLVRDGRCQAVQLEIGLPLRWPGPRRDSFMRHIAEAFAPRTPRRQAPSIRTASPAEPATSAQALQVFDPRSRIAVLASVDPAPAAGVVFGRVALFLPDGGVGLYTAEAETIQHLAGDGPAFTSASDSVELQFRGSILVTPDGEDYVDLERALSRSRLAEASLSLHLSHQANGRIGRVTGTVRIDGEVFPLDATGFATPREWGVWRRAGRAHWSVRAAFADGASALIQSSAAAGDAVVSSRALMTTDPYAPEEMSIETATQSLLVRPVGRMSIARPVGATRRARITFGPAEVRDVMTGDLGCGIYEYARLIDR